MALPTAAAAERLLGGALNGLCSINGLVGFLESIKKSGGDTEQKKIGINEYGVQMMQPADKKPVEHEAVLMVPKTNYTAFTNAYKPGSILTNFFAPLNDSSEMLKGGDTEIATCDWDAAVVENDIVKVTITLRALGYGTTTTYTAPSSGGGGA
ncbi:hypothetical protein EON83_12585 [bacterium]|nr:MAG: hypothetical protein EON83_12585 [bacterium]